MDLGLLYEFDVPQPWEGAHPWGQRHAERRAYAENLEQIVLADKLGFDTVWCVEHHFRENRSHMPSNEVVLGALSQITRQIKLGFGVALMPHEFIHPARVAEKVATVDLLSKGRAVWGMGRSTPMEQLAFGVDISLFVTGYQLLTARSLTLRQMRPGAIIAAIGWLVLQRAGTWFVGHIGGHGGAYGVFSVVLGLIAYLYLFAIVLVFCAEINVVRENRLWPRALLTPFTDNVQLTRADEKAYTMYAKAQRHKGFQHIEATFDSDWNTIEQQAVPPIADGEERPVPPPVTPAAPQAGAAARPPAPGAGVQDPPVPDSTAH